MSKIVAAIDNSAAARPVLSTAVALGGLLHASVEAIHVRDDPTGRATTAIAAAERAGISVTIATGPVVRALLDATAAAEVEAMVLGTRSTPFGRRPAGSTALAIAASSHKPLVVVPPDCESPLRLERILVPHDATRETAAALSRTMELACSGGLEVVVVHVYHDRSLPLFEDQPQHEADAWVAEFRRRYCAHPVPVRIEVRTGLPNEVILRMALEVQAHLIVLGWSRDLTPGHGAVVRRLLEESRVPVLLAPLPEAAASVAKSSRSVVRY